MKIIGFSGKMGTGKTTCANYVLAMVRGAVKLSFADALREEVSALLSVPIEEVRSPHFKAAVYPIGNRDMTGREILQWWGTEIRRAADADYWLKRMQVKLHSQAWDCPLVVIDDVRFSDEMKFIHQFGGYAIRLEPYPGWQAGPNAEHPSEMALDDYGPWDLHCWPEYGGLGHAAKTVLDFLG